MDIFGRTPADYSHLLALQERGAMENHLVQRAREAGVPPHNFNVTRMAETSRFEDSAVALGYLTNNLQAVQSVINETLYADMRLGDMIPIISDVPEGARTYMYRIIDRAARGDFITHDGSDAPSAQVGIRTVPYTINYAGIVPRWTIHDLRQAAFAGVALDSELIQTAARGAMQHIELVAFEGDKRVNYQGLTNQPVTGAKKVTSADVAAGDETEAFTSANDSDGKKTVRLIQKYILKLITDTKEVFGRRIVRGLNIYLPIKQAAWISTTQWDKYNERSVWDYVRMNNAWTSYTGEEPRLRWLAELENANGAGNDRMIIALNNTQIMEMAVPIMPRVITTLNEGFTISSPMEYTLSGLNVKHPKGIIYVNNVSKDP